MTWTTILILVGTWINTALLILTCYNVGKLAWYLEEMVLTFKSISEGIRENETSSKKN